MKKYFFMAVAAIAALSSCTSDNDLELNQNTAKEALTFTATIEGSEATRATFDKTNKCAAWEEGDEIYVIDYNWKNEGARYKAGSDGTTTTFTASESGKEAKDAENASKILGITLTRSSKTKDKDGKPLSMAGFPYHALDTYLPKLIRAGQRVAICDQIEAPKQTVKRGISELLTPGAAVEESSKNQQKPEQERSFSFSR